MGTALKEGLSRLLTHSCIYQYVAKERKKEQKEDEQL